MPLQVQCGECFTSFRVREELAGKSVRCKACGSVIRVGRAHEGSRTKSAKRNSQAPDDDVESELPLSVPHRGARRRGQANRSREGFGVKQWLATLVGQAGAQVQVGTLLAALVCVVQIPCFIAALRDYDFSLMYYRSVLYFAFPSTVVVFVLYNSALRREVGSEPDHIRLLRWVGLAAIIGACFLPNNIRSPVMKFVLTPLGLWIAFSSMGQSSDFRKQHPVFNGLVMLLPVLLLLPLGHLLHAAMMRERRPQEAVETLLPFLEGVL